MNPAETIRSLDELLKSSGWAAVLEGISAERERAVRLLADPKTTRDAKAEHDFLRGVIYTADRLIEMPSVLKQKVESLDKINSAPKTRANGNGTLHSIN
jgi:hypothetical protein